MKVGIWGYGFVGQAQHSIINALADVTIYDLYKSQYCDSISAMRDMDMIFVCVPTPNKEYRQDPSFVQGVLNYLANDKYRGIVVIKSTILHEHIEEYTQSLNICYNPEFLNQNTSFEDALNQECIILGGDYDVTGTVQEFYRNCTHVQASYEFMTIKEASDFKYTRNLYGAYKVLFWEFIQDTTGNARKMADLYKKMEYQSEMSQVGMDGFRGFGGACFPKDTKAWDAKHKHQLTEFMLKYNQKLSK
jgi:UDP-glucose 6-dehydrogenase